MSVKYTAIAPNSSKLLRDTVYFMHMKNFTVIYMAPVSVLEEWMKKPEAERKDADTKMRADWDTWMKMHASTILNTIALGKTKRVSAAGVADAKNDMMLSSYVQGESAEAVADIFKDHPHLGIPGATIEIMEARSM
jgi:hypothetical protein